MKSNKSIFPILILLLLLNGCGGGGGDTSPSGDTPVAISVAPVSPVLTESMQSLQLTATQTLGNGSTANATSAVTWTSSNNDVARVNSNGVVTPAGSGTVVITATSGSLSDRTAVFVRPTLVRADNELAVTVNGSLCSPLTSGGYLNKPCVSVTVCAPGSSTECQTIGDILLDTGSYGLRLFKKALTVLPAASSTTPTVAECINFADGTTSWGPVQRARVVLAREQAVDIPIQVIDHTFGNSSICGVPDTGPVQAGFTGILGIGVFTEDCGPTCVNTPSNGIYFSCSGTNCSGTTIALADQVLNPAAALPAPDNAGLAIKLPDVPADGASSLEGGSLVFGIESAPNNAPGSVRVYNVDITGNFPTFPTIVNGTSFGSFLDTGSNGIFIPRSLGIQVCPVPNNEWFCPSPPVTITASTPSVGSFSEEIASFNSLIASINNVFTNLGGPSGGSEIDWGLPFFLGRDVFMGFEGRTSPSLGTGPYWAFQSNPPL